MRHRALWQRSRRNALKLVITKLPNRRRLLNGLRPFQYYKKDITMNSSFLKGSFLAAVATAMSFTAQSAKADQIITTTFTAPVVISTQTTKVTDTLTQGPGMLVTTPLGVQAMVPSMTSQNQVLFVTTGATITSFTCCEPDDLLTRRDDLLARIFAERATGKLTGDQATGLIGEVQNAFAARASCSAGGECDVEHVKDVKRIYRQFDRVSNDIVKESHQGNRQLAGKYNFVVL